MGEVYRGRDERLDRDVALKVVHADKRSDPAVRARFVREARALSKFEHPNICRIYDVIERDDGDYLVLELIDGVSLRDEIRRLTRDESIAAGIGVARVLAAAHSRGVIHRDLKPENVMLTRDRQVKVLDFGLARGIGSMSPPPIVHREATPAAEGDVTEIIPSTDTLPVDGQTSAGTLVGTLRYMSPEQARGDLVAPSSDVYALGLLLSEMLAHGESPFGHTTSHLELFDKVRLGEAQPLPLGDRHLDALIARMLDFEPEKRPTAAEVVVELQRIADRPRRRRQRIYATAAIVVAAIVAGAAFFIGGALVTPKPLFGSRHSGKIAVLPFRNATGAKAMQWADLGIMDLLSRALTGVKGLQVVSGNEVFKAMNDLRLPLHAPLTDDQHRKLLDVLGADALVDGSLSSQNGNYVIRYAAFDRAGAERPRTASAALFIDTVNDVAGQLARRVDPKAVRVDVHHDSADDYATILMAMGREEERARGPRVGSHYYTVALDRDPNFLWAKLLLAQAKQKIGERDEAQRLMRELQPLVDGGNDLVLRAGMHLTEAMWANDAGDYAAARQHAQAAIDAGRRGGDLRAVGRGENFIGLGFFRTGRFDDARPHYDAALRAFTDLHSPTDQALIYNNLGLIASNTKQHEEATRQFERVLAIARAGNNRMLIDTANTNLALQAQSRGDFAAAIRYANDLLASAKESGDKHTEAVAVIDLAAFHGSAGHYDDALVWATKARELTATLGQSYLRGMALNGAIAYETYNGLLDAAQRDADTATAFLSTAKEASLQRDLALTQAYLLIREGKLAEAEKKIGERPPARVPMMLRARIAYERGDYRNADALARQAKALNDGWYAFDESSARVFAEAAATGRRSAIALESPIRR